MSIPHKPFGYCGEVKSHLRISGVVSPEEVIKSSSQRRRNSLVKKDVAAQKPKKSSSLMQGASNIEL